MANTPDRWQALREAHAAMLKKAAQQTGDCGPGYQHQFQMRFVDASAKCAIDLLAAHDALALECKALREALRNAVVSWARKDVKNGGYCHACKAGFWHFGEPEKHAADCLAQLKE